MMTSYAPEIVRFGFLARSYLEMSMVNLYNAYDSDFRILMSHNYDVIESGSGQNRILRPKFSRTEYNKAILHVK